LRDELSQKRKVNSKRVLPTSKKSSTDASKENTEQINNLNVLMSVPLPQQDNPPFAKLPTPSSSDDDEMPAPTGSQKTPEQSTVFTPLPPIRTTPPSSPAEVQWLKDPPPSAPNPVPRSVRRSIAKTPPPFANDPLRQRWIPQPSPSDIEKLNGDNHLSTVLLDYLLQKGLPSTISDNVLIGSSNSLSWFLTQNQKSDENHTGYDPEGAKLIRRKYQFYSLAPYQFFVTNCGHGHFTVAWVSFDPTKDHIFDGVYNSNISTY
jgi:hypothetical protein